LTRNKLVNSAHDISDGGLAVALAESCIINRTLPVGCNVNIKHTGRRDFTLCGESQSRVIVSFAKLNVEKIKEICNKYNLAYENIGQVGGTNISINTDINIPL